MNKSNLTGGGYSSDRVSSSEKKNWKLVNFCELDKYAVKSYCAIHGVDERLNLGDITKVDDTKLQPFNMICGGSPCQDFSVAGKQKGSIWTCRDCGYEYNPLTVHWSKRNKCPQCNSSNIEKTRSSLLVEYLRVVHANKPNFGIYENVKNIVGKKFKNTTFKFFEDELHEYGYNTYWKVLNAKNYGIPQNRERVYLIFIRRDLDNGQFKFPEPFDSEIRLKDLLEDEVDEKFYLSDDKVQKFLSNLKNVEDRNSGDTVKSNNVKQIGSISDANSSWNNPQTGRIYSVDGISPTLNTCGGGQREPKIVCDINKLKLPDISYRLDANYFRGISPEEYIRKHRRQLIFEESTTDNKKADGCYTNQSLAFTRKPLDGLSRTLKADGNNDVYDGIRIRKLIPKETWRLMGFSDRDFDVAKNTGNSDTQLYKQAGNSIVVDVLYYIYVELYKAMPYLFDDLKLSSFFSGIGAFEAALDRLYEGINSGNFTNPQVE